MKFKLIHSVVYKGGVDFYTDHDGDAFWSLNNKLHREDGPACEWNDGDRSWYLDNNELTEKQFNEQTRKDLTL